jgi:hypothetical protein
MGNINMHNKLYTQTHLKDLYKKARNYWDSYVQWKKLDNPNRALSYFNQCEALVALMENIQCFHVGMGKDMKHWSGSLKDRLNSFKPEK